MPLSLGDRFISGTGLPTPREIEERKKRRVKAQMSAPLETISNRVGKIERSLKDLTDSVKKLEKISYQSMRLQENQLIVLNALLPEGERPFVLEDKEIRARRLLDVPLIGSLNQLELKAKKNQLAKKIHPDASGIDSSKAFIELEEAFNYLVELHFS